MENVCKLHINTVPFYSMIRDKHLGILVSVEAPGINLPVDIEGRLLFI